MAAWCCWTSIRRRRRSDVAPVAHAPCRIGRTSPMVRDVDEHRQAGSSPVKLVAAFRAACPDLRRGGLRLADKPGLGGCDGGHSGRTAGARS
jgi:hypothetical protein